MSTIDDAKKIIESSGNNFHCKVINYFKEKGWYTLISPYYTDNVSNKPREIDLVVEKAFPYSRGIHKIHGSINVKLYIECKFIPQINVFWFADKDRVRTEKLVINTMPMSDHNNFRNEHHYLKNRDRVAKLFAGGNNKKRNLENEVIYKALNQSLNAMVYHRNTGSIIPETSGTRHDVLQTLEYPVIICNSFDKFFRTEVDTTYDPVPIKENFQLEVNYAYMDFHKNQINEFFLIDVLDFGQLVYFLEIIENDVETVKKVL